MEPACSRVMGEDGLVVHQASDTGTSVLLFPRAPQGPGQAEEHSTQPCQWSSTPHSDECLSHSLSSSRTLSPRPHTRALLTHSAPYLTSTQRGQSLPGQQRYQVTAVCELSAQFQRVLVTSESENCTIPIESKSAWALAKGSLCPDTIRYWC